MGSECMHIDVQSIYGMISFICRYANANQLPNCSWTRCYGTRNTEWDSDWLCVCGIMQWGGIRSVCDEKVPNKIQRKRGEAGSELKNS